MKAHTLHLFACLHVSALFSSGEYFSPSVLWERRCVSGHSFLKHAGQLENHPMTSVGRVDLLMVLCFGVRRTQEGLVPPFHHARRP